MLQLVEWQWGQGSKTRSQAVDTKRNWLESRRLTILTKVNKSRTFISTYECTWQGKICYFLFNSEQCCDINNYKVSDRIWLHLINFLMFPPTFQGVRLLLRSFKLYSVTYKVQAKIIAKKYYQQQELTFIGVMTLITLNQIVFTITLRAIGSWPSVSPYQLTSLTQPSVGTRI